MSSVTEDLPRRTTERRRRRVLFALAELDYPTPALRRVGALATALDGDLHVLRVLLPACTVASRPRGQSDQPRLDSERERLARRGTAAWWERTLRMPFSAENIHVCVGDFAGEISAHARALSVACVILAPVQSDSGRTMEALLSACRQPVFSMQCADWQWAALLAAAKAADDD